MAPVNNITFKELKNLSTIIPAPLIVLNNKKVLFVNQPFTHLTGYGLEDLCHSHLLQAIHPDQQQAFVLNMERVLAHQPSLSERELQVATKEGSFLWVEYQTSLVSVDKETLILAVLTDITAKKLNQLALRRLIKLRESMLEITQSIIGVVHMDLIYTLVLEKAIEAIETAEVGSIMLQQGSTMKVVAHQGFSNVAIEDFQLPVEELFLYKETEGQLDRIVKIDDLSTLEDVYTVPLENNAEQSIKSSISAPIVIHERFFGVVGVESTKTNAFTYDDVKVMQFIRDNVEIAISSYLLQEEKHFLSQFDTLTGLYNRSFFEEIFEQVIEKARRYNEPFQLVLFDINNLKMINDSIGHVAGDQLIRRFSEALKEITRKSDLLGRYGGDEFIAVFHHSEADELHEKLIHLLSSLEQKPMYMERVSFTCSFSYGIATFDEDGASLKELVRAADQRMYAFKDAYKANNPRFFRNPTST